MDKLLNFGAYRMSEAFFRSKFRPGWIEVIAGCMFSGKSEELIRQLRRAQLAKQRIQVFKPEIDQRYSLDHVASHNQSLYPSIQVNSVDEILHLVERNSEVIGIDEGQFFENKIVEIANILADSGKRVIVAGLDTDWQGKPFGPIPHLMAIAEVIRKQYAICMVCGEPANRTQRLVADSSNILVGSSEAYEARCRIHFDPDFCHRLANQDSLTAKRNLQNPLDAQL